MGGTWRVLGYRGDAMHDWYLPSFLPLGGRIRKGDSIVLRYPFGRPLLITDIERIPEVLDNFRAPPPLSCLGKGLDKDVAPLCSFFKLLYDRINIGSALDQTRLRLHASGVL